MRNSKRSLQEDIRRGTSLLEIVGENIEAHVELFDGRYYKSKKRTRKEIIKVVVDNLNERLKKI